MPRDDENQAGVPEQSDGDHGAVGYDQESGSAHRRRALGGVCPIRGLPHTEEAAVVGHGRGEEGEEGGGREGGERGGEGGSQP